MMEEVHSAHINNNIKQNHSQKKWLQIKKSDTEDILFSGKSRWLIHSSPFSAAFKS